MTLYVTPATRRQMLINFLMEHPGEAFTLPTIAEGTNLPLQFFVTDIRKWMDTAEFAFVHRRGEGGRIDPFLYWYDSSHEHAPLPQRQRRSARKDKGKTRVRNVPAVPDRVLQPSPRDHATNGRMAMIIFQEGDRLILLDDQDRLIRGKLVPG